MKKIYVISPVTVLTEESKEKLLNALTRYPDYDFYVPFMHTDQNQPIEEIMFQNLYNIKKADEVWVAWDENTRGGIFDLGCAVASNKPISLVPGFITKQPAEKSIEDFLLFLEFAWLWGGPENATKKELG